MVFVVIVGFVLVLVGGSVVWDSKQTFPQILALSSYFHFLKDGSGPEIIR